MMPPYLLHIYLIVLLELGQVRTARVVIFDNQPQSQSQSQDADQLLNEIPWSNKDQRPLYNIAHMANSIKKTLTSLNRGANAVEVDVSFNLDDITLYHGYPCDCFRFCWDAERLEKYLTFARKITTPGNANYQAHFVILYFDVKLTNFDSGQKFQQGIRFADYLEKYFFIELPVRSTLKLIISISYAADVDFLRGLIWRLSELHLYEHIRDQIGFDVGMDTEMDSVRSMWSQLNVSNIWQGEGITNCFNPIIGHQLEKLVQERDQANSYCSKVYRWTIDLSDSIKAALRYGIDGIMTNHPERVVAILREPEFARNFRLATILDNPFSKLAAFHTAKAQVYTSPREKVITLVRDLKNSVYYFVVEVIQSLFVVR